MLLFAATLLPFRVGLSGHLYLGVALLSGLSFVAFSVFLYRQKLSYARKFASVSIVYLFILIVFLVADKA